MAAPAGPIFERTLVTEPSRRRDLALLTLATAVALTLVAFLVVRATGNDDDAAEQDPAIAAAAAPLGPLGDQARRLPDDPMALGSPTAPVVLIEFADFRCPFCAQFSRQTQPQLVEDFVDSGVLRIEWRDLPIFGEQSMAAARAARAAAAQGKFWEYTDAVYRNAPARGKPDLTDAVLQGFARDAGVPDMAKFTTDATSSTFDEAINRDVQQAMAIGIPSTPAFSINGTPVLGAQPTEEFTKVIANIAAGRPADS
jgi:protein-disulfide isomerase